MPDVVFWPLFVTFAAIAIGATLKGAEAMHGKKFAEDECTRLRAQLEALNGPKDKGTIEVQALSTVETKEPLQLVNEISHAQRLSQVEENILKVVAGNDRLDDAQVAEIAGVNKQLATLHLHELRTKAFLRSSVALDGSAYQVDVWFIEQVGRKYLHHHGLL